MNVFQFASDTGKAFAEAARVTHRGGTLTMLVWGPRDKCELMSEVMPVVFALEAPRSSAAKPPLVETAEGFMREAGLALEISGDLTATLTYASRKPRRMPSSPIRHAGVRRKVMEALVPFVGTDGAVRLRNVFRLVTARRPA